MTKADAKELIKRLRVIFARFGYPRSIQMDNARVFDCAELKSYARQRNIELLFSTPYWPQENGEVERQNRSLKKRLIISQTERRDWKEELQNYLLMYRSSPHTTTDKSPGELMFGGRILRDKLPQIELPMEIDESVQDKDKEKKEKGKVVGSKIMNAICV